MTARTAIAPIVAVADGSAVLGAGTAAASTMTVASPGAYKLLLQVLNGSGASFNVTIRARNSGVDASGNAQSGDYQPMAQASVGDLVIAVANGATALIGPLTLDRFQQADGSLSIDLSATTSSKVWAIQRPYQP